MHANPKWRGWDSKKQHDAWMAYVKKAEKAAANGWSVAYPTDPKLRKLALERNRYLMDKEKLMRRNPIEGYLFDFSSPGDQKLVSAYVEHKAAYYGTPVADVQTGFEEIDLVRRGVPFEQILHALTDGGIDADHLAAFHMSLPAPSEMSASDVTFPGQFSGKGTGKKRDTSAGKAFKAAAAVLGVSSRIRNKTFTWNNENYIVIGLNPGAKKEPVDCKLKHDRSGVLWTFPLRTVKSQLTRAGINWRA